MLTIRALACAAFISIALFVAVSPAYAHGNLDQTVDGDPGCNTSNFPASVTAAGGQRQTFIPTGSSLSSIGLCISAASPGTDLVVGIRTGGGALVGGGSSLGNLTIPDSAGPPVRFVHVDFTTPLPVTPGAEHIIEIQSGATLTWYGTTSGSPYDYCHGAPNTSAVQDFAFLAYTADAPAGSAACPGPPPTNTPRPPTSTNTPQQAPTDTPVPGTTPTVTPTLAPGQTPVAQPTAPIGTAPQPARPSSATNSGGAQGSTTAPGVLPASGHGSAPGSPRGEFAVGVLAVALALSGAVILRRSLRA